MFGVRIERAYERRSNSLLNANTEGAGTTGLGRTFQMGTILQEKEFLKTKRNHE